MHIVIIVKKQDICMDIDMVNVMNKNYKSSLKWSDPGRFLKCQGKFFFVISMYPFLHIFDT